MKRGAKYYILWCVVFVASVLILEIDGMTRTKYIGVSIPIEVLAIILAFILLLLSYTLSNAVFSWFNWLLLLLSTVPFGTFILLAALGSTFGYVLSGIIYCVGLLIITRWQLVNPDKSSKKNVVTDTSS